MLEVVPTTKSRCPLGGRFWIKTSSICSNHARCATRACVSSYTITACMRTPRPQSRNPARALSDLSTEEQVDNAKQMMYMIYTPPALSRVTPSLPPSLAPSLVMPFSLALSRVSVPTRSSPPRIVSRALCTTDLEDFIGEARADLDVGDEPLDAIQDHNGKRRPVRVLERLRE